MPRFYRRNNKDTIAQRSAIMPRTKNQNQSLRISLIAAFYKDINALKLIIDSLRSQDYDNFELIVAEDNNSPAIEAYLQTITDMDIIHTRQNDIGIRKSRSQNNAIIKSTGDYLIFIDADCIPYRTFVSAHAKLAEKGCVLSGRRVNTGPKVSSLIRNRKINTSTLEHFFILGIPMLLLDGASHISQGLYFDPNESIYKKVLSCRAKTNTNILGCNFSCFKSDMLAIDGFDESYGQLALPDDTDIQWRFKAYGLRLKSCKMAANVFHLHHKIKTVDIDPEEAALMNKKMNEKKARGEYKASIGISSHKQA